jgi:hypothetical protein
MFLKKVIDHMKALTRHSRSKSILVLTSVLLIASNEISFAAIPVQASLAKFNSIQARQMGGRVPGRRRGGARRSGACPTPDTELTALVPANEATTQTLPETYVGGSTTAEYPTFWFYVPHALTADLTAEFILQDDSGQDIYRATSTDFPASEQTPGIVGVSLPATVAPLEVGKTYQWYFKLNCEAETPLYVQGGIERIPLDPNLASQLANASPSEQANLYVANDIWYDAITVLAQLHRSTSNDPTIKSALTNLLQSVGLEDIAVD